MRLLKLFLPFLILFSTFRISAEKISVPVVGLVTAEGGGAEVEVEWSEKWFGEADSFTYSHRIARVSAILSSNAYSDVYKNQKDGRLNENPLFIAYRKLGIAEGEIQFNYGLDYTDDDGIDQAAFSLASKKIASGIGEKNLVFVTIRGTIFDESEWISNLNIADGTRRDEFFHEGFRKCSEKIYSSLKKFLSERKIEAGDSFFLISGHSRGAAAANLLSARLADDTEFDTKKIYAYPVACPNVVNESVQKAGNSFKKYGFIWNLSNEEDLVTAMPPHRNGWNFAKYGRTLVLPCRWNTDEDTYENVYLPKVNSIFERIMGRGIAPFRTGPFIPSQVSKRLTQFFRDTKSYYSRPVSLRRIGERALRGSLDDCEKKVAELSESKDDGFFSKLIMHVIDMHAPESYVSWMLSLDESQLFKNTENIVIVIKGNANCAVLDKSGKILMADKNSKIFLEAGKNPVGVYDFFRETSVGVPCTDDFSIAIQKESVFPSPVKISVEKYDGEGIFIGKISEKKVYARNGSSVTFDAGKIFLKDGNRVLETRREGEIGELRGGFDFYLSPEFSLSHRKEILLGLHLGTRNVHGTFLFSPNDRSGLNDGNLEFSLGLGSETNIFARIFAEAEVLWNFRSKTPAARLMLLYRPLRRMEFFAAGEMEFDFSEKRRETAVQFGVRL